ncbi:MAG: nucleotide sugar dehydrogenase [Phycisphaerales bacterium]|nr:nucleotide sugar dehydrogenase [Phycisphaerales bacterium]
MSPLDQLERKIADRSVVVGVVGLGYVGLPLASALHSGGARVIGFDVDPAKITAFTERKNYLKHLGDEMFAELAASDRFDVTTDFVRLGEADVVIVCVPTPLREDRSPNLSYVTDTARAIGTTLRPGQLIVLESTTYPGTTRREFLGAITESASVHGQSLRSGENFLVAFSPEREDPGRKSHATATIPKLVGGLDDRATRVACDLYRIGIREVIPVSSAEVAEAAKILENVYRAVNIALVNEMKLILSDMDIDVFEVVRAAATKPFGFQPFYPGPGLGGHCIPIDPYYLAHRAKEVGREARFIELAGEINHAMPAYVVDKCMNALQTRGVAPDRARVLVLGLAYKPDIDDVRESPSFELIELLREKGSHADYSDPFIKATWKMRRYNLGLKSVELTPDSVASYDAVIISTNHTAFDYEMLAEHARLVVDTRDAMRIYESRMGDRLIRA